MKALHKSWRDMMAASYGPAWETELDLAQRADCKRMFMAGALVMFNVWNVDEDETATEDAIAGGIVDMQVELLDFSGKAHDDVMTIEG